MEEQHPIEGLMVTAMNSIKQMIDVNTIIGEPIKALDNTVIIPISKVGFGFAAGGSEFTDETVRSYNKKDKEENIKYRLPFGGGSGAGVNITPVAFLIVQNDTVKLLEANHSSVLDKLVEYVPDVIDKINNIFIKKMDDNEEENISEDDDFDWEEEQEVEDSKIFSDDYDDDSNEETEEEYFEEFEINDDEKKKNTIIKEEEKIKNDENSKEDNKKIKKETRKRKIEKVIKEDILDEED